MKKYNLRKNIRSCYNCQHSRIIKVENDKQVYLFDCTNYEVDCRLLDKYNRNPFVMPGVCGRYKPILITKCKNCNKAINEPIWNWPYWVEDVFEDLAVCCPQCRKELLKKLKRNKSKLNFEFKEQKENTDYPF